MDKPTPKVSDSPTEAPMPEEKIGLNRTNGKYELPEVTHDMVCPVCEKPEITLTRTIYKLPDGDDLLILLMECGSCSYKNNDLISLYTAFKPGVYRLIVDDGDLDHKVFRGATGTVNIPEIGVEIERGPAAKFEFTNLEGIFERIEHQLQFFLRSTPDKASQEWINANDALMQLKLCKNGKLPFTVILTDPQGGSYINPSSNRKKQKLLFTPTEVKPTKQKEITEKVFRLS